MTRHYAVPAVVETGYAFYAHVPRTLNNDVDIEHERLPLDLAAGLCHPTNERGYEKIVLFGNRGGGSLLTFYQQQATTRPPGRLTDTKADELVLLAVHPGQGAIMRTDIDPSVIDQEDPLATDPEPDMYHLANGFTGRRSRLAWPGWKPGPAH